MSNVLSGHMLSQKVPGPTAAPVSRADEKLSTEDKKLVQSVLSPPLTSAVGVFLKAHQAVLATALGRHSINGNKHYYVDSVGFNPLDNTTVTTVASSTDTTRAVSPIVDIPLNTTFPSSSRTGDYVRIRDITVRGTVRIISSAAAAPAPSVMPTVRLAIVRDRMPLLTNYAASSGLMTSFLTSSDPAAPGQANSVWVGSNNFVAGQYPIQNLIRNRSAYDRYDVLSERLIDDWKIPIAGLSNNTGTYLGNAFPIKNFEMSLSFKGQGDLIQWLQDTANSPWLQVNQRYFIVAMVDSPPATTPGGYGIQWSWSSEAVFDDTPADS